MIKWLCRIAIVNFVLGTVRVDGVGGNDMKARQASEASDDDGHSRGLEERG
jgi:hypothetical protein